jgi:hypothetical protein
VPDHVEGDQQSAAFSGLSRRRGLRQETHGRSAAATLPFSGFSFDMDQKGRILGVAKP